MSYNMWDPTPPQVSQTSEGPDFELNRQALNAKYTRPLVAFDRDGVLFETDGSPILSVAEAKPIKSAFQAITKLRHRGFKIAMISDQPGISQGLVTREQVEAVNQHALELLGQFNCPSIDGILYNESNNKQDYFAKPKTGMFKRLRDEFGVPYKNGYYIGDQIVDAKMAMKAGLVPVLVRTGLLSQEEHKLNSFANRALKNRTIICDTFLEFADTLF